MDLIEGLDPDEPYDLALISVRRDQLAEIIPELAAARRISTILFMLNNPGSSSDLARILGSSRVMLGFPGAGGMHRGHIIRYIFISQQPTMLGEWSGLQTVRLHLMADMFRQSGFPTTTSRHMDAWLKVHAFFVTAVCGAIYLADGSCRLLSKDTNTLTLMSKGVREGFSAVRALGLPVRPFSLGVLFSWLPQAFAIKYWQRFFASDAAELVFGGHARTAPQEMREIANDCLALLDESGVRAPALLQLYRAIDSYAGASKSP